MENYMDYLRCGEIYKSPSQSDRSPYIVKCFNCGDVFLLLESFIFHVEDHCIKEAGATAISISNIESEIYCEEEQKFTIAMVDNECSSETYKDAAAANFVSMETEEVEVKPFILKAINETNGLENNGKADCLLIEDTSVEIKNEPISESHDDFSVSDVSGNINNEIKNVNASEFMKRPFGNRCFNPFRMVAHKKNKSVRKIPKHLAQKWGCLSNAYICDVCRKRLSSEISRRTKKEIVQLCEISSENSETQSVCSENIEYKPIIGEYRPIERSIENQPTAAENQPTAAENQEMLKQ